MTRRSASDAATPPDGWITRDQLVAATGIGDRNLVSCREEGFVPRPVKVFLGGGGSTAYYPAESVAMIKRLYELQRQGRDADAWLWGLWLDPAGYHVDIRPWILRRLDRLLKAIKAIGDDRDQIERLVAEGLKDRKTTRKLRRRGIDLSQLGDLVLWAYRVAADIEQHERLDSPDSSILYTLRQLTGLPQKGFADPDRRLGVELMSFAWLKEVAELASPKELEQVRRDCRALDHIAQIATDIDWRAVEPAIRSVVRQVMGDDLPEPPSIRARKDARKRPPVPAIVRYLLSLWDEFDFRAVLIAALVAWRKRPEYGTRITELLGVAVSAVELYPRLPASGAGSSAEGTES
jgi:hypothetical protein